MIRRRFGFGALIAAVALCFCGCLKSAQPQPTNAKAKATPIYEAFAKLPERGLRNLALDAPTPPYPEESLRQGHAGVAVIDVNVEADGHVMSTELQEAPDKLIGSKVVETVRRWRFQTWRFPDGTRDARSTARVIFYFEIENGQGRVLTSAEKLAAQAKSAER